MKRVLCFLSLIIGLTIPIYAGSNEATFLAPSRCDGVAVNMSCVNGTTHSKNNPLFVQIVDSSGNLINSVATAANQASMITLLGGGLPATLGTGGGLKIDGSGTALPVSQSGVFTFDQGNAGTDIQAWPFRPSDGTATLFTLTNPGVTRPVIAAAAMGVAVNLNPEPAGGIYETTPTTITNGTAAMFHFDASQNLKITAGSGDPCATDIPSSVPIDQAADTELVAASGSKVIYVCGITAVAAVAEAISLVKGTGTVCATNKAALIASATDSKGMSFATNGGISIANSGHTQYKTAAGDALCLTENSTGQVSGALIYVQK